MTYFSLQNNLAQKRIFRDSWLHDPDFLPWLKRFEGDNTRACCRSCKRDVATEVTAIKRRKWTQLHAANQQHLEVQPIPEQRQMTPTGAASTIKLFCCVYCRAELALCSSWWADRNYLVSFPADGASNIMRENNLVSGRLKTALPAINNLICIRHPLHLCASEAPKTPPSRLWGFMENYISVFLPKKQEKAWTTEAWSDLCS